jgi:hypothetical protein
VLLKFSSGSVRSRRRRRDAPAAAATDAATTTCASDTGSATASQRITRSDGRGGSSGGGHETRGQHRLIEPSRRKSRQKQQGGDRALRDGRQAFLPVVDERVADLFRRDRPRHLLVEVEVFSSVRPLPVLVTPTPPMVPLPTTPSTLPWPRRPPRGGGDVAGDPSSTPV